MLAGKALDSLSLLADTPTCADILYVLVAVVQNIALQHDAQHSLKVLCAVTLPTPKCQLLLT